MSEYYMSSDIEYFDDGPFRTREDAIEEGKSLYPNEVFWVGRKGRTVADIAAMQTGLGEIVVDRLESCIYDVLINDEEVISLSESDESELNKLIIEFLLEKDAIRKDMFEILDVEEFYPEDED